MRSVLVLFGLAGCSPAGSTSSGAVGDWATVRALLDRECAACHATSATTGIALPNDIALDLWRGGGAFVAPFDPDASSLWRVLSDGTMPAGAGPLPDEETAPVRAWIEAGAEIDWATIDIDGDGAFADVDCDEADPERSPGRPETCDGRDDDCDRAVDEDAADAPTWFADADGDGFGDRSRATRACDAPRGYVANADDCDDGDAAFNPAAPEGDCDDPNDYNCDGSVGRVDADDDGFAACEECDDALAGVFPGATETCDGLDDDCDGLVDDDAADAPTWYADADADGFGDPEGAVRACEAPTGYAAGAGDCDDTDPAVNPSAPLDPVDGVDDDCDGTVDEDASRAFSHAADVQPIWDTECASCHGGRVPSEGLDLSGDAYADLVGVPSSQVPAMDLVSPGDPDGSYLWHKLNDTHASVGGTGGAMPKSGSLPAADLATIEAWILGGAPP